MSQATTIEWTDATWNPVRGCKPVSPGCRNCYAESIAARFCGSYPDKPEDPDAPFHGFAIMTDYGPKWTGKVELIESKLLEPLHWKKPRRVFVNSMSDLFHENLGDDDIDQVFAIMALCQRHTFQVLTKRADRMRAYLTENHGHEARRRVQDVLAPTGNRTSTEAAKLFDNWPLRNVWLGVSTENQETADSRIRELLRTPAAVRFISYEPALGQLDPGDYLGHHLGCAYSGIVDNYPCAICGTLGKLDWVITGGESGPDARPNDPQWFRDIRDQCQAAHVPFFFKQWGGVRKGEAGATLDGREWKEFPKGSASE